MNIRSRRVFASVIVAGLVGALAVPMAAFADYGCAPTTALERATVKTLNTLDYGVELGKADFDAGVANTGGLPTRVMWARGSLSKVNWAAPSNRAGETSSQYKLASDSSAVAFVNTDYYNEGTRFPFGAMLRNGELVYAPAHSTNVVATAAVPYTRAGGYPGGTTLKAGAISIFVSGVNTGVLAASSSATVITDEAASKSLPEHRSALWVLNGKVAKVMATGALKKPQGGYLILAKGARATKIRKLKVGA
jgi:hypothetical protein